LLAVKGDVFIQCFDKFIQRYFSKGVTSIFTEVEKLYDDKEKVEQIEKLIKSHI